MSKIKLENGEFSFHTLTGLSSGTSGNSTTGLFDIYQHAGENHQYAFDYTKAKEFLSGFNDGEILSISSSDALIQSGRNGVVNGQTHTDRLVEFAGILSGFGAREFINYTHRDGYNFIGIKSGHLGAKIYEELGKVAPL